MTNLISSGAYSWPRTCALGADEHQASGVDQIGQVEDEVNAGEDGHSHDLIPDAEAVGEAAGARPVLLSSVFGVKVEDGPDDGHGEVEEHSEKSVTGQEAGEGEGKAARALADAQDDDPGRQDETDAVDGHAVLKSVDAVIQDRVADEHEDDTGDEGFADFQEARGGRHVARDFSRTSFADAHLGHVGDSGQTRENGRHNSEISCLAGTRVPFEVVQREDDGGGEAEERGVAGERDREVLPGDGSSGLEAKELHKQDEEGPGETEGPAEDAPVSSAVVESAAVDRHREGHAGEGHRCQTGPEQRSGVKDDSHDVELMELFRLFLDLFFSNLQMERLWSPSSQLVYVWTNPLFNTLWKPVSRKRNPPDLHRAHCGRAGFDRR